LAPVHKGAIMCFVEHQVSGKRQKSTDLAGGS
jgi:hypothetical protein